MKRLSLLLLLLPLAGSALFGQSQSLTPATLPNGAVGTAYSAVITVAPSPQVAVWSISVGSLPPGLTLFPTPPTNSAAGSITGTPTAPGTYSFTVQANVGLATPIYVTRAYTVVITGPLTVSPAALPNGSLGVFYSQQLVAAGGYGAGTYSFSLVPRPGPLPPGISLSAAGMINGTPTTIGTFGFSVNVVSQSVTGASLSILQAYSITVALPTVTVVPAYLPDCIIGAPCSQTLTATGGYGPGTYTFALTGGSLPPGLTLSANGAISGTPTDGGPYSFTVQVTSQSTLYQPVTGSGSFSLNVNIPPPTIVALSLPAGTIGIAYSQVLAATGGTPPYTWSSSASLPDGLTLDSASGTISGTPTKANSFTFLVTVHDSQQAAASAYFTIKITAPNLVITTTSLPPGNVGAQYTATVNATGGTPPYTWSVTLNILNGNLLNGLAIDSTGVITASPAVAGTFSVTVVVTDSVQTAVSKGFTIIVVAGPKITTAPPLADGVTGVAYTQQFAASGGVTPYVWSVASGSIPSGLSLNTSSGLLSGTPDTAGTSNFTIGVADQNGATDSAAFSIKIAPPPLTITTQAPLPGGAVGVTYTQAFSATGGTLPYQWSVSTGTAPTGLTLNSDSGSLTGTPTATGTFNFTVQVADSAAGTASKAFTIVVATALIITETSPLPGATVSVGYNQALAVTGGSAPFTWSIASGTLPPGIVLNTATLNGLPSAPGTFTFTISVTGGGQTATKQFTMTVGLPAGLTAAITGLPATPTPATQPALGISIPSAYPLDITGTVTMTFAPDSPSPDDPAVVFTTGGRTASFQVAANSTQAVFSGTPPVVPGVQIGTVSGIITLTLKLTAAGGVDVTPSPAPTTKLTIAKSAPVIKTATVTRTSSGFNLVVVGYATSREMVSANVGFTAAAGVTLASSQATVSLAQVFTTWYADPTSAAYGSNFSLTIPFTIANGTNPLTSVSVQLTNAQGASNSVSAAY